MLEKEALSKARKDKAAERRSHGLPTRVMPWERLQMNPKSLRRAVNLKCIDCVGGPTSWDDIETFEPLSYKQGITQSYRQEIKDCNVTQCPLHQIRQFQ